MRDRSDGSTPRRSGWVARGADSTNTADLRFATKGEAMSDAIRISATGIPTRDGRPRCAVVINAKTQTVVACFVAGEIAPTD